MWNVKRRTKIVCLDRPCEIRSSIGLGHLEPTEEYSSSDAYIGEISPPHYRCADLRNYSMIPMRGQTFLLCIRAGQMPNVLVGEARESHGREGAILSMAYEASSCKDEQGNNGKNVEVCR